MTFSKITKLGEGFFGEVWREHDNGLDRDCAVKYLDLSKLAPSADVFAEAKLMIDAKHDNVVEVYSADFEAGTPVIRMEYLPDRSVADRFAGQPAPPAAVVTIIQDACRGVEHLHSRGLLHRDIKPANLLLGPAGVKVSDFGLACTQSAAATAVDIRYDLHCPPETLGSAARIGDI